MPLPTASPATPLKARNTSGLEAHKAHILLYGKTKSGKTTTAISLEEDPKHNAIISTQPEEQLAHLRGKEIPYVIAQNFGELNYALGNIPSLFPNAKTVIIDDFTTAVEYKRLDAEKSINDGRQIYGEVMKWADKTMPELLFSPYNIILTAFERELKEDGNPLQLIGPDFPPSTAGSIMAKMDFILRLDKFKMLTKRDDTKRILAGNRWPVGKVSQLQSEVEPDLRKLWCSFQAVIKG